MGPRLPTRARGCGARAAVVSGRLDAYVVLDVLNTRYRPGDVRRRGLGTRVVDEPAQVHDTIVRIDVDVGGTDAVVYREIGFNLGRNPSVVDALPSRSGAAPRNRCDQPRSQQAPL